MKLKTLLAAALALTLALTASAGVASASKPENPGKSEEAPGQVQKAEHAPEQAQQPASAGRSAQAPGRTKTGQAATPSKGKSAAAKAKPKPAATAKTAARPQPQQSNAGGRSAEAHHHVIVCHATGSASNPYVVINIPMTAWTEAHSKHQDGRDFILKDPASRPGSKDGFTKADCVPPAQQQALQAQAAQKVELQACPPATAQTVTETTTTVLHHAGPRKVVEISPSEKSVHYRNKHPDDLRTVTVTRTVVAAGECPAEVQQQQAVQQQAAVLQQAVQEQEAEGAVLGVQHVQRQPAAQAAQPQARGGVLGAVAAAQLPFTGLPLWIAVAIGLALVAAGLGARRALR